MFYSVNLYSMTIVYRRLHLTMRQTIGLSS